MPGPDGNSKTEKPGTLAKAKSSASRCKCWYKKSYREKDVSGQTQQQKVVDFLNSQGVGPRDYVVCSHVFSDCYAVYLFFYAPAINCQHCNSGNSNHRKKRQKRGDRKLFGRLCSSKQDKNRSPIDQVVDFLNKHDLHPEDVQISSGMFEGYVIFIQYFAEQELK
ncbi:hypothetical protein HN858_03440 [Candidatus Falkowbacteria bacterium]|jgi:hypothetical protein|nr:hypothetical protein [Candidatus Falkowbacteria bacterium]MBT5502660.1 hypothetical protein [Candidatus Falkowbacteria bacterium]MBT6574150.1 hypothetical protein [Candidatus Falkowbacteria bacterium]MBT7348703.1 hypothetical protein [Candidatus Falkowbacteria bacterium]MBT7500493.1 hypothetical protein [Candidatus Falkowbacteria bacterium]